MKEIVLNHYQQNGESDVEAFIDSYLELLNSGLTHEEIAKKYVWVEDNEYYNPDSDYEIDEYDKHFLIEDVEDWFNNHARNIDPRGKWTNQDVLDVFDGKCTKEWGNYVGDYPFKMNEVSEYKGIQYVKVFYLFFACTTYLVKTKNHVFSIWY